MAEGPSIQDVKKLLDNPGVSDAVKRELLTAFVAEHPFDSAQLRSDGDRLGMPDITLGGVGPGPAIPEVKLSKAMDDAAKQLNRRAAEDGKRALGEGGSGAANSNPILDMGAPGLRYFEYFAPLYRRCVSSTDIDRDKACELYDEQRDMDFWALRSDAATIGAAASTLSAKIIDQRNAWNTVDQIWTGKGAEAANSYVSGYLGQAQVAQGQVQKFGTVLAPAADALEKAVRDKAKVVADLYADSIGGKSPAQIDEIISYAQSGHNIFSDIPETLRILSMFGASVSPGFKDKLLMTLGSTLPGGSLLGAGSFGVDLLNKAQTLTQNFVDNVFKPDVEGKWRALVDTSTATDKSVREIYRRIVDDVNSINDDPFTAAPGGLPPISKPTEKPRERPQEKPQEKPRERQPEDDRRPPEPHHPSDPTSQRPRVETQSVDAPPRPAPHPPAMPAGSPPPPAPTPPPTSTSPAGFMPPAPSPSARSAHAQQTSPPLGGSTGSSQLPDAGPTKGVAWVRDPATLPQGWTIDSATGELKPPAATTPATAAATAGSPLPGVGGAAVSGGPVEVHSPAARELLDHDGVGDLRTEQYERGGEPGAGTDAAGGAGAGVLVSRARPRDRVPELRASRSPSPTTE